MQSTGLNLRELYPNTANTFNIAVCTTQYKLQVTQDRRFLRSTDEYSNKQYKSHRGMPVTVTSNSPISYSPGVRPVCRVAGPFNRPFLSCLGKTHGEIHRRI
jgi:hypothetical protein